MATIDRLLMASTRIAIRNGDFLTSAFDATRIQRSQDRCFRFAMPIEILLSTNGSDFFGAIFLRACSKLSQTKVAATFAHCDRISL